MWGFGQACPTSRLRRRSPLILSEPLGAMLHTCPSVRGWTVARAGVAMTI